MIEVFAVEDIERSVSVARELKRREVVVSKQREFDHTPRSSTVTLDRDVDSNLKLAIEASIGAERVFGD